VSGIHTYYGSIHALRGVSLAVWPGEIVTLIGSNGAGKSTTLKTISGLLRPRQGEIRFEGQRLDRRPPHEIVRLGVSQVPEGRHVFPRLTVDENLEMGAYGRHGRGPLGADRERVFALFPRLKERLRQRAGTLSGGEQQMLAIGRALMAAPRVLLLDEPSMGLAPVLVDWGAPPASRSPARRPSPPDPPPARPGSWAPERGRDGRCVLWPADLS
jgi:branched-chain amino acid transport system ATP-binding protein